MPDVNFVVKNGLTVNGSFTANSTVVSMGANVTVNTTTFFVNNAAVNTNITAGSILLANSTGNTSIAPGLMILNAGAFRANSTVVNAVAITASSLNATSVNTATANATTSIVVGDNVAITTASFFVSNTSGNTTTTAGLIVINGGAFRANSTVVNAAAVIASTVNATSVNTATANATTSIVVGGNVLVNTTAFFVNNASVNTNITAGQIAISGVTVNSTIYQGTANNANNLNGQPASYYTNATNIASGTLSTSRLAFTPVNKAGDTMTGDLTLNRSTDLTTGALYLGNSGTRYLYYDGTNYNLNIAGLNVGGNITAYASDARLKENFRAISTTPLEDLKKISGYRFEWRQDGPQPMRGTEVGLLAQEVESVLPEAIAEAPFDSTYKTIKLNQQIIALMIEAIKELSAKVDELEKRI